MQGPREWIHALVIILVVSIACVPVSCVKYVLPVPSGLYVLWLVCGGCPLSEKNRAEESAGEREVFIHTQLSKLIPGITHTHVDNIIGLTLTSVLMILCYRVLLSSRRSVL